MFTITISILVVSLVVDANSLQCYHCNSTFPTSENTNDYPNCVYPDARKEVNEFGQLVSCDEIKESGNENNEEQLHPLCMLVTSKTESGEYRMRSCVEGASSLAGQCIKRVEKDGSERRLCYCSTDECNATPETALGKNVPETPIKCYECLPGDSIENAELPACLSNSTDPGNLITCSDVTDGCQITTIDLDGIPMNIRKCSSRNRNSQPLCVTETPVEMPEANGETCYCNEDGCNVSAPKVKLHSIATNTDASFLITTFVTILSIYFL